MSVLYLALPLALILAAVAVTAFVWSVNDGQLDDLDTPAVRLLNDDQDGLKQNQTSPTATPAAINELRCTKGKN
ncbi:MAG: cbb3-type cytochrome oxidase assembly protein CcoS [Fuerstiella sp.]